MIDQHPVVVRYLAEFEQSLGRFDYPDHQDAISEIRNHIAEACTSGKPLDLVLTSLGSADVLARAYATELLLNRRSSRQAQSVLGFLKLAGVVAALSLATFAAVGILGTAGIGFVASGVAIIVIGGLEQVGIHLPGVEMNGIAPVWAVMLGLLNTALGVLALVALRAYVRWIVRANRSLRQSNRAAVSLA